MRERQQHERLIVQVGARVEDDALMVEAVDVEAVVATTPLDEKIDIGVDHLPPGTGPPERAEFTIGEDVPGLNEQAMRAGVLFAVNRKPLRKKRRLGAGLGAPEIGGRLEQPLPGVRRDILERGRAVIRVRIIGIDLPLPVRRRRLLLPARGEDALAGTPPDPRLRIDSPARLPLRRPRCR
jgi:hypothetical protein